MKFANYRYSGKNINNLGDHVQILTFDYLYQKMGIPKEDIIYIDLEELGCYEGEPVRLPVSMPLMNYHEHGIADMFSGQITPVFFGLTLAKDNLLPEEVLYLKKHEPIGCRDERTFDTLSTYGILAYLGGCLTVTIEKRETDEKKQNKVFIIDPTKGVADYIPQSLQQDAIVDTHMFYEKLDNPTELANQRYTTYKEEAKLVITSLLHCSIPCMAMGIPVILAKDVVSYRFAWVEALLQIYTPNEYHQIDWEPNPIECEFLKRTIREMFQKRMLREEAAPVIQQIHDFYMDRRRKDYVVDAFVSIKEFIDRMWTESERAYNYSVWGLTQMADMTVSYIEKLYPNARLMHVYDLRVGTPFKGIRAIHPDATASYPDETVFVTAVGATEHAKRLFEKTEKSKDTFHILGIVL